MHGKETKIFIWEHKIYNIKKEKFCQCGFVSFFRLFFIFLCFCCSFLLLVFLLLLLMMDPAERDVKGGLICQVCLLSVCLSVLSCLGDHNDIRWDTKIY